MALETIPVGVTGTPDTDQFRQMVAALLGAPEQTFAGGATPTTHGGAHGVVGDGDFAVTAQGSPNLTVAVAKGYAFVQGTSAQAQGAYVVHNDDSVNVSITPDATLSRIVYICLTVQDAAADSSGATGNRIHAEHGTPSGTPTAPALEPGTLVLAQVFVDGGATQITAGNISDRRTFANALGGVRRVSSTSMPTAPGVRAGDPIYQRDTDTQFVRTSAGANLRTTPRIFSDGVEVAKTTGTFTVQTDDTVAATDGNGAATIVFPAAFVGGTVPALSVVGADHLSPVHLDVVAGHPTPTGFIVQARSLVTGAVISSSFIRVRWTAIGYT